VFPFAQHDSRERRHLLVAHGLADHDKGFLADLILWNDVIATAEITLVNLRARRKRVDVDCLAAFNLNGLQLVIIDHDVGVLCVFVAPALIFGFDNFARDFVHELLTKTVTGLLVDLTKGDTLCR
jgi:hypothetical protein